MTRFYRYQTIISLAIVLTFLFSSVALARFRPKTPTTPRGRVPSLGTRGCSTGTTLDFTALAPVSTIAKLTLDQPTLAWFVPDRESYPMTLRLYQDVAPNQAAPKWKVVQEFKLNSRQGVMSFRVPPELLQEGQVYAWQAILMCVPGYPSGNLIAEAQFEVVPTPADLKQQLDRTTDVRVRSQVYAAAGLWHGAFAEAMSSKAAQSELLNDLIEYEQSQDGSNSRWAERGRAHSKMLGKIAQTLRNP